MAVEDKLAPYLTGPSSANTQPILFKLWILHLMTILTNLMIPGGCQGGGGGQVGVRGRVANED